jgi:hypothetical protein
MWWRWYIHTTSAVPPPAGPQRRHGGSELPVEPVSPEDVSISRPSVGELRSFDSSLLRRFSLRLPETRWKSTGLRRCRRPCTRQEDSVGGPTPAGPRTSCGHNSVGTVVGAVEVGQQGLRIGRGGSEGSGSRRAGRGKAARGCAPTPRTPRPRGSHAPPRQAAPARVRVEIMGSQKCGIVGKSQPVLMMIDPIIFTHTRGGGAGARARGRWVRVVAPPRQFRIRNWPYVSARAGRGGTEAPAQKTTQRNTKSTENAAHRDRLVQPLQVLGGVGLDQLPRLLPPPPLLTIPAPPPPTVKPPHRPATARQHERRRGLRGARRWHRAGSSRSCRWSCPPPRSRTAPTRTAGSTPRCRPPRAPPPSPRACAAAP